MDGDGYSPDQSSADRLFALAMDVTDPGALDRLVAETVGLFGRLDILVNNAGVSNAKPFDQVDDALWQSDLDLKLGAAVTASRRAAALARGRRRTHRERHRDRREAPRGGFAADVVSRAAGLALTKAMSKDLAADGILVNAVCIGLVKSGQQERSGAARGLTPARRGQTSGRRAARAGGRGGGGRERDRVPGVGCRLLRLGRRDQRRRRALAGHLSAQPPCRAAAAV